MLFRGSHILNQHTCCALTWSHILTATTRCKSAINMFSLKLDSQRAVGISFATLFSFHQPETFVSIRCRRTPLLSISIRCSCSFSETPDLPCKACTPCRFTNQRRLLGYHRDTWKRFFFTQYRGIKNTNACCWPTTHITLTCPVGAF